MADALEIDTDGAVSSKRRFDKRDFDYIAQSVIDEYHKRKEKRKDREKSWKEIDRQIAMEPEVQFKYIIKNGTKEIDPKKAWMSEVELPYQAQALEVITSDCRRLMFPDSGTWFRAHAETTDEYYSRVDFQSFIKGDEVDVPSKMNQDNADKLVEGFLAHLFNQTDFAGRVDRINAESIKYGMGVGRARTETKNVYIDEARGVRKETQKIPVLVPCSIKNLYLDSPISSMHSAQVLGQSHIAVDYMKLENLLVAASKGSNDPKNPDGGWMPQNLKGIVADDKGYVTVLEMEGDIVIPRKTVRSFVIPGAIVTVLMGGKDRGGSVTTGVIRLRFRKDPFSSYLLFPYHMEGADDIYSTSPLMKGRPIQILATDAANRLLDCAMLKIQPPLGYDRNDSYFAQNGGPAVYPGAQWGTSDVNALKAFTEVGGEPAALASMLQQASSLYAELTGVLPGRLGAETKSHTTAFSKDAELQRGAVRTVDYVNSVGQGAMVRWLDMAYRMGMDAMGKDKISFFIEPYGGYVEIDKSALPDSATFDWLGAGGPADNNQKMQNKVNAALLAVKLDQANLAMQKPLHLNINNLIDQIMREGGWVDLDAVVNGDSMLSASQVGPGPLTAGIQNLALQQPQ